jgi:hypothetical protein
MGIKVNVSEQESRSGDREPLPAGKYHMAITDVTMSSPADGENIGKPMLVFEFTVQDSPDTQVPNRESKDFLNRKDFVNACLWEGALYTIVGILKALGEYENSLDSNGDLDVPTEPEFYLSRELYVRRAVNRKQKERFPDIPDYWIQAQGYSPYKQTASTGAPRQQSDSLLP